MTPNELEAVVENLNTRVVNVAQILPTLATKQDLHQDFSGLRQEFSGLRDEFSGLRQEFSGLREDTTTLRRDMMAGFSELRAQMLELRTQMLMLFEDNKSDIRLLTEHIARGPRNP